MSLTFSPLDGRYSTDLPALLSEEAFTESQVAVEKFYLMSLMEENLCPVITEVELDRIFSGITSEEISKVEARTRHATRALVEVLIERLKAAAHPKAAEWVHVGITSFDTVDTAQRLRLRAFFEKHFFASVEKLQLELQRWTHLHSNTLQVGRTHGQWAVPSFFGLIFAEAHERMASIRLQLQMDVAELRGQSSGAVGGYQALGLLVKDPMRFEVSFLKKMGLKPHLGSTQILPPEDLMNLAQNTFNFCSVVAKLATDLRHLARSEISEISEGMAPGQVGSSTMPQKRNPWNLEHVCSLFKVLTSRVQLMQMDMISEHQRDLTNSASGRFYVETFSLAFLMVNRLTKVLVSLEAHPERMKLHLKEAGSSIFAEALYVMATRNGVTSAHDQIREASREAEKSGKSLLEVALAKSLVEKTVTSETLMQEVLKGPRSKIESIQRKWRTG